MKEWYTSLSGFEQVYWGIALIASVFFIYVLFTTILGSDADDFDGDAEVDGDAGFQFLSFKNLVGFFTIFGWSGVSFLDSGYSHGLTILLSTVCGLAMMFVMAFMIYKIHQLASSGTLKLENAIDQVGEVYLTIGANRSRMGKVQINVQGGLRTLQSLTDEDEDLPTHAVVKVKEVTANGILIVESIKSNNNHATSLIAD